MGNMSNLAQCGMSIQVSFPRHTKLMKKNKTVDLATSTDVNDRFSSDRDRLRYMKENYASMSIAEAFSRFYDVEINEYDDSDEDDMVASVTIGNIYLADVKSISQNGIEFTIPGIKDDIFSKENFMDCIDNVRNYLMTHENKLLVEIREKRNGTYYGSVLNAYYRAWQQIIEKAIAKREAIDVHIDSLVKGGYICHTNIWTITDVTGKNYTSGVFIPGSQIVLNIEKDFEKWLDQDVQIIPNKFAKYRSNNLQCVENSIVGSRKQVLQIIGMQNMYEIWTRSKLANNPKVKYTPETFEGVVTGIINSNKKTGVFIEISDKCITGLMPVKQSELLDYKPGDIVYIKVKEFECQDGKEPFVVNKSNKVIVCNVRAVFERA